jgi:hypothetical protein
MAKPTNDEIVAILTPWFSNFIVLTGSIQSSRLFFGTYQSVGAYGYTLIVKNSLNKWYGTYFRQFFPANATFKIKPTIKSPGNRATWRKEYANLTTTLPGILNSIQANPSVASAAIKFLNNLYQYININPVANDLINKNDNNVYQK